MDTTKYAEGKYLTPQYVKESQTKNGIIVSLAEVELGKFGEQISVLVNIDGKIKTWKLNQDSVKNMHKISVESDRWLQAQVSFSVVMKNNKEVVIGSP